MVAARWDSANKGIVTGLYINQTKCFSIMSAMEEMLDAETLDEEISFLEKNCERLCLEIEKKSLVSVYGPMCDPSISTMTKEHEGQSCLPGEGADDTVIMLNAKPIKRKPLAEGNGTDGVTTCMRKTTPRNSKGNSAYRQNAHVSTESA